MCWMPRLSITTLVVQSVNEQVLSWLNRSKDLSRCLLHLFANMDNGQHAPGLHAINGAFERDRANARIGGGDGGNRSERGPRRKAGEHRRGGECSRPKPGQS